MAVLEIHSELFAQLLAGLLSAKRRSNGGSRTAMARQSAGRFNAAELRRFEEGRTTLSPEIVAELTGLYDVDLADILPARAVLTISPGAISVGGKSTSFVGTDDSTLLTAYLQLVRSLRNQRKVPIIVLRREDIESLAAYLDENGEDVLDRLGMLMGATRSQRTSMTTLFSTSAAAILIVGASAIANRAVANHHVLGPVRAIVVVAVGPPPTSLSSAISTISAAPVLITSTTASNAAGETAPAPVADPGAFIPTTTGSSAATAATGALTAAAPAAAPTSTAATSPAHGGSATSQARSTTTTMSEDESTDDGSTISFGATPGGDQAGDSPTMTAPDPAIASDPPVEAVGAAPVPTPTYAVGEPPVRPPTYAVGEPPVRPPTYAVGEPPV
ncbi:MAG: hypothetical protein ABIR68_03695, partial [Ilumatobacteraceae bacterium]